MSARVYQAATVSEALAAVRRDLGAEAMVLKTRTVRRGGVLGLGGRQVIEIVAAGQSRQRGTYAPRAGQAGAAGTAIEVGQIHNQLSELRTMVAGLANRRGEADATAGRLGRFYQLLISQDVEADLAGQIIAELEPLVSVGMEDSPEATEALADLLERRLACEAPGMALSGAGPAVIALIGPTGVGKTTTIAKLAARYRLIERRRVALITLDSYRIGAVDQLKTYAGIIGLPLQTVLSPAALREAIESLGDYDVVLIDSAGRSQHNAAQLSRLGEFVAAAQADQVHVVLSATSSASVWRSVLREFVPLGARSVIVTKLDEAATCGIVLNVTGASGLPLSYVTVGQEMPDDIEPADAARLARRIIGGVHGR